jgi:hypothetical protein
MSQTATITVTENKDADESTRTKGSSSSSKKHRGRLQSIQAYDTSSVYVDKNGKERHRVKSTIKKREGRWYENPKHATGTTLRIARLTGNFRKALDENRRRIRPVADVKSVSMTVGAAEAYTLIADALFNTQIAAQGEICHNHRTGKTSQLTGNTVDRSWNARGFFLHSK